MADVYSTRRGVSASRHFFVSKGDFVMNTFKNEPHLSYSQLNTYIMCPLKYQFAYIDKITQDFVPAALPFGGSIHEVLAAYYRSLKDAGIAPALDDLIAIFETDWRLRLESEEVVFDNGMTPRKMEDTGIAILRCFYDTCTPGEIIAVEAPFRLRKLDPANGTPLPLPLVGVIDLVERDASGRIVAVDHKTAARKYTLDKVEQDLQLTIYSAALKRSRIVNGAPEVHVRLDVLLKTKTPDLCLYESVRTDEHRRKMFKTVQAIANAIEQKLFYPNPGWQCPSCQYKTSCDKW
jgi:putative RecB family exonuclease